MIHLATTRHTAPRQPSRLAAVVVFCLFALTAAYSQLAAPTELQVQAAYLYKFGAFVTWPNPAPGNTFTICVLGRDPFGPTLDRTVQGEALAGQQLVVSRVTSVEQASQCRILFISTSEDARARSVLAQLNKLPVLTVSDMPHFLDRGGMIQFVLEAGRVRFEVNLTSADQAGLTLSSQLLKVASAVKRAGGRE
jgi:hypothetical protein